MLEVALPRLLQPPQLLQLIPQGLLQRFVQFGRVHDIGVQLPLATLEVQTLALVLRVLGSDPHELRIDALGVGLVVAESH